MVAWMDTPRHSRLPSLTGIRSFAALGVFCNHAFFAVALYRDPAVQQATAITVPLGTEGVTLFFVLSGLVLTWSARTGDSAPRFWRRRLARILPNHLATWIAAALLVAGYGVSGEMLEANGPLRIGPALASLFLVHVWYPSYEHFKTVNPVTWSLACELAFYLAFPSLYRLIHRIPNRWLWRSAGLTVLAGLCVPCLALSINGPNIFPTIPVPTGQMWLAYFFPLSRLPEFLLGMLLARIIHEGLWKPLQLRYLLPLPFLAIAILALLPPVFAFSPYFAAPAALLVAEVASRDLRGAPSPFRHPVLVYWGDRSFAFYLVHYIVIMRIRQFLLGPHTTFSTPVATGCVLFLLAPLALAAAWLLHRLVELPCVDRFSGSRRTLSS